jgi:hypothetical protein
MHSEMKHKNGSPEKEAVALKLCFLRVEITSDIFQLGLAVLGIADSKFFVKRINRR